jgi:hypothetical protein
MSGRYSKAVEVCILFCALHAFPSDSSSVQQVPKAFSDALYDYSQVVLDAAGLEESFPSIYNSVSSVLDAEDVEDIDNPKVQSLLVLAPSSKTLDNFIDLTEKVLDLRQDVTSFHINLGENTPHLETGREMAHRMIQFVKSKQAVVNAIVVKGINNVDELMQDTLNALFVGMSSDYKASTMRSGAGDTASTGNTFIIFGLVCEELKGLSLQEMRLLEKKIKNDVASRLERQPNMGKAFTGKAFIGRLSTTIIVPSSFHFSRTRISSETAGHILHSDANSGFGGLLVQSILIITLIAILIIFVTSLNSRTETSSSSFTSSSTAKDSKNAAQTDNWRNKKNQTGSHGSKKKSQSKQHAKTKIKGNENMPSNKISSDMHTDKKKKAQ